MFFFFASYIFKLRLKIHHHDHSQRCLKLGGEGSPYIANASIKRYFQARILFSIFLFTASKNWNLSSSGKKKSATQNCLRFPQ
eukprot:UN18592